MSSQDSNELPPLVIVEEPLPTVQAPSVEDPAEQAQEDGKPAPNDTPQAAPATNTPVPAFPKHLPHVHINALEFESGFPESSLVGVVDSTSLCAICQGYPRRPVSLDICGHLFCEPCIKRWYQIRASPHGLFGTVKTAPCPVCREAFQIGEILTWELWQKWAQLVFNAKVVRCPFECGFQGTASDVDHHQVRECAKRKIDCPLDGCRVRGQAEWIEKEHFPRCPMMHVYCPKCKLPVRASVLSTHDCIARLHEALHGILTQLPCSDY